MTDRRTAATITDQELAELYTDADRSEEVIGELNEHVINFQRRAERAELALARIHHLADRIAAGAPWTANHDELATRIREAATVPPAPAATQATSSAGQLRDLLAAVLGAFPDSGPDGPAIRSRPLPAELVHRWRQTASRAQPEPNADVQALETTARVFAGLHQSAESTVTRVIGLYEQWVKAGPPPLGASMARWWDKRLAELHTAIQPPALDTDQTTEK
jgi:hypothetical protein